MSLSCDVALKNALRRVKRADHPAAEAARHSLVKACRVQGAYIQFGSDLRVYGLWEALLYAKNYEDNGDHADGAARKALAAAIDALVVAGEAQQAK